MTLEKGFLEEALDTLKNDNKAAALPGSARRYM